jgi:putative two-component system response regulator
MLERLALTADIKEDASGEHGFRVGQLSALVAGKLQWDKQQCHALEVAARLHDLGKIGVSDRVLFTSKTLVDAERQAMQSHTMIGAELLASSNMPQLRLAEEIARSHHEWWNGTGYPFQLAGKRIPLHARIVALADVFDALTHGRPYAPPWPIERALQEITRLRAVQFDPELTDVFVTVIERLCIEHTDLDAYLGKARRNSQFIQARERIRVMVAEERESERGAAVSGNSTQH